MGDEDQPRDADGKFASGGSGGGKSLRKWVAKKLSGDERAQMKETVGKVKEAIGKGQLAPGMTLGKHVQVAKQALDKHHTDFDRGKKELEKIVPPTAVVKGRVKELESALGKLTVKPEYGSVDKLQDTTGMRVVAKSLGDVDKTVAAIHASPNYKVVAEDNYIKNPKGAYRSHHLVVETKAGLQKEIQVRTERQNAHADWAHEAYKPKTPGAKEAMAKSGAEINAYSKAVSDHYNARDRGQSSTMPKTPTIVSKHFGALPDI